MSRDINPYGLRMPPALKEVLEKQAEGSLRSLNAEIVARLTESLKNDGFILSNSGIKDEPQIYTVSPGKLNKGQLNQHYKKESVDYLTLTIAIEAGEQQIASEKKKYTARKKALLFSLLYDSIDEEEPSLDNVDKRTIKMLMELAG